MNNTKKVIKKIALYALAFQVLTSAYIYAETDLLDKINSLIEEVTMGTNLEYTNVPIVKSKGPKIKKEKEWTIILYISADNDLKNFAIRNIKQMAQIGSNEHLNIAVHLDTKLKGNKKVTRRYYIEKNKILHVNANDQNSQKMDSGNPETLISCCKWAIENFPAKHYGLILWNHGTGAIDPKRGRIVKLTDFFTFNFETNKIDLDRSIEFLDFISSKKMEDRGICWDDTTGNYLTNHNLDSALDIICSEILGKKFDFIGFDACLMQMIEVAYIIKKYTDIMIGSQEVILGTGWNYIEILKPFIDGTLTAQELAKHIVESYRKTYGKITNDFTLSALRLNYLDLLENNIDKISKILIYCLKKQKSKSVKKAIASSRNKLISTHFDEPSFIDLHHFNANIQATIKRMKLINPEDEKKYLKILKELLIEGRKIIEKITLANVVGKNLSKAKGISIYFPTRRIYYSYRKLTFSLENDWILFLTQYQNV